MVLLSQPVICTLGGHYVLSLFTFTFSFKGILGGMDDGVNNLFMFITQP